MKTVSNILTFAVVATSLLLVTSCGSKRETAGSTAPAQPAVVTDLPDSIAARYGTWHDMNGSVRVYIESPINLSASARATMVRNENILLSMRVLGMEIAALYIDSDSVFVVDRYHKYMIAEPFTRLAGNTGLTISDLQDVMLGRLFYPGSDNAASRYTATPSDGSVVLTPDEPFTGIWHYTADLPTATLSALTFIISGKGELVCRYNGYYDGPCGVTASGFDIEASLADKSISASLQWQPSKIKWNSGRTMRWTPPTSGYRRIDTAALLQALKNKF